MTHENFRRFTVSLTYILSFFNYRMEKVPHTINHPHYLKCHLLSTKWNVCVIMPHWVSTLPQHCCLTDTAWDRSIDIERYFVMWCVNDHPRASSTARQCSNFVSQANAYPQHNRDPARVQCSSCESLSWGCLCQTGFNFPSVNSSNPIRNIIIMIFSIRFLSCSLIPSYPALPIQFESIIII